jgi:CheY-like chemotaxis protein
MVADDDGDLRRIVGEALAAAGCTVRAVADGVEALEALDAAPVDVAVLDLLMPGLDGLATVARMRAGEEARRLPVVLLLGSELSPDDLVELDEAVALARQAGMTARPLGELLREAGGRMDSGTGTAAADAEVYPPKISSTSA